MILDLDGAKCAKNRKRRRRHREIQQQRAIEKGLQDGNSIADDSKRIRLDQNTEENNCSSRKPEEDNHSAEDSSEQQKLLESVAEEQADDADNVDYDAITESYLKSSIQLEKGRSGGHRAGFDAFMTGFIAACILSKHTSVAETGERALGASIKLQQLTGVDALSNKIYTMGKDQAMIVGKSNFCNPSRNHRERMQQMRKA